MKRRDFVNKSNQQTKDMKENLEMFDNEFHTKISENMNITLLKDMYNEYISQRCENIESYRKIFKTTEKPEKELINSLNNRQKDLLDEYLVKKDTLLDKDIEQAYAVGVATGFEISQEINNIKKRKRKN